MSNDDKKKRSSTDTARRIWLAGIGAYGRAFTEAQGAIKEVTGKGSEVFDDLVQKGEMIEKVVEYKGRELLDKTKAAEFDVPSLEIDERIRRMRARLHMGASSKMDREEEPSVMQRLRSAEEKIETLLARIEALETKSVKPKTTSKKKAPAKTQRTKAAKTRSAKSKPAASK